MQPGRQGQLATGGQYQRPTPAEIWMQTLACPAAYHPESVMRAQYEVRRALSEQENGRNPYDDSDPDVDRESEPVPDVVVKDEFELDEIEYDQQAAKDSPYQSSDDGDPAEVALTTRDPLTEYFLGLEPRDEVQTDKVFDSVLAEIDEGKPNDELKTDVDVDTPKDELEANIEHEQYTNKENAAFEESILTCEGAPAPKTPDDTIGLIGDGIDQTISEG
eukprot:5647472-Pyramimonas_sp.AAC.1